MIALQKLIVRGYANNFMYVRIIVGDRFTAGSDKAKPSPGKLPEVSQGNIHYHGVCHQFDSANL